MRKRPPSVTAISWLFIAVGVVGIAHHASELKTHHPFVYESVWILLIRALAIVAGVYMLREMNWARWLAVLWLAYHVILSGFHSWQQAIVHGLLLAVFAYILFRPQATEFFRGANGSTS